LFQSIGFALPANVFAGELALIELPLYSFLVVNNNHRNRGFTAACNTGLQRLRDAAEAYQYGWLLNNDTVFESRMQFEQALAAMQALALSRNWGIVSQQIRRMANRDAIVFGGARECYPAGRHNSGSAARGDWSAPTEEKWVTFCSVLIRWDVVATIGGLDETMVTYYSDSDYCLTARLAGFTVGYAGAGSYVFHRVGQSADPGEAQQRVYREDYLTFWRKWIGGNRHGAYLELMSSHDDGRNWQAGALRSASAAFPEMNEWLGSLHREQRISLRDALEHFQHRTPATDFSILCNIAEEMIGAAPRGGGS
jgi:GT2 family glycosyltransferase